MLALTTGINFLLAPCVDESRRVKVIADKHIQKLKILLNSLTFWDI